MLSDPTPPSDSTPSSSTGQQPGESYADYHARMVSAAAEESQEQFEAAIAAGDMNDPAVFLFMESIYNGMKSELNDQVQKSKEASKKLKDSLEGKEG